MSHSRESRSSKLMEAENQTIPPNMRNYHYTGTIRPHYPLSPTRIVPEHVARPDYADHREFRMFSPASRCS